MEQESPHASSGTSVAFCNVVSRNDVLLSVRTNITPRPLQYKNMK